MEYDFTVYHKKWQSKHKKDVRQRKRLQKKTTKKHTVSTPRYRVTQNDCKDKEDHREAHNDGTDMQTFQQNYIRQV